METKPKLKSKTIWSGAITLLTGIVATFNQPASEAISNNSELIMSAIGALMIILRLFTTQPVE